MTGDPADTCPEPDGQEQPIHDEPRTTHELMIQLTGQCPWCGATEYTIPRGRGDVLIHDGDEVFLITPNGRELAIEFADDRMIFIETEEA